MKSQTIPSQPWPARGSRRVGIRAVSDLLLLLALAFLLPALVQLPLPLLRVPLGIGMVLFAPGYALTAALFARRADLDWPTRAAWSIGLSIAILPLLALALNALPWGIRLWPITVALALWVGVFSCVALVQRLFLVAETAAAPAAPTRRWSTRGLVVGIVAALALAGFTAATALVVATPDPSAKLTEFYVLGAEK